MGGQQSNPQQPHAQYPVVPEPYRDFSGQPNQSASMPSLSPPGGPLPLLNQAPGARGGGQDDTSFKKILGIVIGAVLGFAFLVTIFVVGILPSLTGNDDNATSSSYPATGVPATSAPATSAPAAPVAPSATPAANPSASAEVDEDVEVTAVATDCDSIMGPALYADTDRPMDLDSDVGTQNTSQALEYDKWVAQVPGLAHSTHTTCSLTSDIDGTSWVTTTVYGINESIAAQLRGTGITSTHCKMRNDGGDLDGLCRKSNAATTYYISPEGDSRPVFMVTKYGGDNAPRRFSEKIVQGQGW